MEPAMNDWVMIHGRFQPFHLGHLEYLGLALAASSHVAVGITSPEQNELTSESTSGHRHLPSSNPWSYFDRMTMVLDSAAESPHAGRHCIRVVPFDVSRPDRWRSYLPSKVLQLVTVNEDWDLEKARRFKAHGYEVETVEGNSSRITATYVRQLLRRGDPLWRTLVPAGTAAVCQRSIDLVRAHEFAEEDVSNGTE
jgi:nicotinamide-nucleotide adenylyltransferase